MENSVLKLPSEELTKDEIIKKMDDAIRRFQESKNNFYKEDLGQTVKSETFVEALNINSEIEGLFKLLNGVGTLQFSKKKSEAARDLVKMRDTLKN